MTISPRRLLIIGPRADTKYVSDAVIAKADAPKKLCVIDGATHIDLDDMPQFVPLVVEKLTAFFGKHVRSKLSLAANKETRSWMKRRDRSKRYTSWHRQKAER